MKKENTIGIVGFGNMGSSLAWALKDEGWRVYVYDKEKSKLKLKKAKNIFVCKGVDDLIKRSPILIIAIKPQDIPFFIKDTKSYILRYNPLLISIAAGVSTRFFEKKLDRVRVIRVMPNLAVKKRCSISFLSKGKFSLSKDFERAKKIFNCVGESVIIDENFLDKVTAISGSGPGYVYYFMSCIYQSARMLKFNKNLAQKMVKATFLGAVNLLKDDDNDFQTWLGKVASKGGTTEAAVNWWEKNNIKKLIKEGVRRAYLRAKELNLKD